MAHSNETVIREAYAAFAKGDVAGFLAFCTPGVTFRMPGKGLLAGKHSKEAFLEKLEPAMQALGGTFQEDILHVVASDEHGAVIMAQSGERDGKVHRWNVAQFWRIEGGRLAEFSEFTDDPAAYEAAWHV